MTSAGQGPTEQVAWIAGALSITASLMFMLVGCMGEANAVTTAAAGLTGITGGLWLGRATEARAVRTGRHMLRQ